MKIQRGVSPNVEKVPARVRSHHEFPGSGVYFLYFFTILILILFVYKNKIKITLFYLFRLHCQFINFKNPVAQKKWID